MRIRRIVHAILISIVVNVAYSQSFDYTKIENRHPRLLLAKGEEKDYLNYLERHPEIQAFHSQIVEHSVNLLKKALPVYQQNGRRLSVGYESADCIFYLSYTYRMTKDKRFLVRLEREIKALCQFPNWNPAHYLDTSTIAMALAVAYDWCFDDLSEDTKKLICESIVAKAFEAAKTYPGNWFYTLDTNWNSVCNAGLVYAALATFEENQDVSVEIVEKCMATIAQPLRSYAPDGAYPEGYGYWEYGTGLQVLLNAALEKIFGTDNGLSRSKGFLESAYYMLHMVGPSGLCFNYSDCSQNASGCVFPLFWFARKTHDSSILWWEKEKLNHITRENISKMLGRYTPLYLCLTMETDYQVAAEPCQTMWSGDGITPVILARSGWGKNDLFFGAKGGVASHSHAHMDAGSFVFDAMGLRWAMDLGMQNYESLEKYKVDLFNPAQDAQRWEILRMNNWHHNTLTVNGHRHNVNGQAKIVQVFHDSYRCGASIDLTPVLQEDLLNAKRDIALINDAYLEIVDSLSTKEKPSVIQWTMCTPASAKIVGDDKIELTQKDKRVSIFVDTSKPIKLKIWSNEPEHFYDALNVGTLRVGFLTELEPFEDVVLKVRLYPE